MRNRCYLLALPLLLGASSTDSVAQDKMVLRLKAKAGQVIRYKTEGTLSLDAMGMKLNLELKQTDKLTIISVAENGNITRESQSESTEVSINGMKVPAPEDKKETSTTVVRPNGMLVSYKSSGEDKDASKTAVRLYAGTHAYFPDSAVGVGDKWSLELKTDNDLGTRNGRADYMLEAFEKVGGIEVAKIKVTFKESEGNPTLSTSGTFYVEKSSGDVVSSELEVNNVAFGGADGPMASGKLNESRTEGVPFPDGSKGQEAKPADGKKPDDKKPEPKKEKTIDEVVKEFEKTSGLFTIYRKKESSRDTIYLEINEEQLDKLMMLQATAITGTTEQVNAGDPIRDTLFQFRKLTDEKLVMVVPNLGFRAPEKTPVGEATQRSFVEGYIENFKIEAKQPDRKSLLIDVSNLFKGDIAGVNALFSGGGGGPLAGLGRGGGHSLDRDLTFVQGIKNFPTNVVVDSHYHFTKSGAGPGGLNALMMIGLSALADQRSIPFKVRYNLFAIPTDNGYKPRHYDPRVGYFSVKYQDLLNDRDPDPDVKYIIRWNVQKTDPKAAMSPAKDPIVFYLDNAIPVEYREAVKEGILLWNKAFEKIGIKDAVVVKPTPANAEFDHADMRYNTIRWVVSPGDAYAIAQFRVNPVNGQILNASITVDGNLMKISKMEYDNLVDPSAYFQPNPLVNLKAHRHAEQGYCYCNVGVEAKKQAWFGYQALKGLAPDGKVDMKAYANQFLRSIVAHEMGHIMGLRHNFIASTYSTLDQLKDKKRVAEGGICASVMDYIAFNVSALKQKGVDYYTPTLGKYDYWAIQYGYAPIDSKDADGELYKLKLIAAKSGEPGLAFQSDEVADGVDPSISRFDLTKNPLDYWSRTLELSRYLILNLSKRSPAKGQSYWEFTRDLYQLIGIQSRALSRASDYVGAIHLNRMHRGDAGEKAPTVPASLEEQNRALGLLNAYLFSESAMSLPKDYYLKLTDNPDPGLMSMVAGQPDMPIRDRIAGVQASALRKLFNPAVLKRISNNEYKVGSEKTLSLSSLFNSVGSAIFSELEGRKNINSLRRQLQRLYIDQLISMVINPTSGVPDDAKILAWGQLTALKSRFGASQKGANYDQITSAYVAESLTRITRALDAKLTIGAQAPAAQRSLLEQLLGGEADRR